MMMTDYVQMPERALVVFAHHTTIAWLRLLLKPGFRHCFAMIELDGRWLMYNPLSHVTQMEVFDGFPASHIIQSFRLRGYRVVDTWRFKAPLSPVPFRPFTCVEAVKRALGLHISGVITPWQLYRFLIGHKASQTNRCGENYKK